MNPATTPVSKSADRIAAMFDGIAPRYDLLNHLLSASIDRRWRRRAIQSLALSGSERVLDLCVGTADLAIAARTANPPAAKVIGVDFADVMLRVGHEKIRRQQLQATISLVRGDATRIPVADRSVDAVMVAFGIRNVERPDEACAEMQRVLRSGGRLAVLEFSMPVSPVFRTVYLAYSRYVLPRIGRWISRHGDAYEYLPASIEAFASPDQFVKVLRQHGFMEVQAIPLTWGIVFLYTARRG